MKKIEAVLRTSRLDEVVSRLRLIGAAGMTVSAVHGLSVADAPPPHQPPAPPSKSAGPRYELMIVVSDDDAPHVVRAILHSGHTGSPGDGLVTVTDVDGVMRIRTGETDADAL